ncbi:MAG: hypothetical protein ACRDXD_10880 [Acidimicrobiia bacterium]
MPDDDHGDPRNITNRTFEQAAQAVEQSAGEARDNTLDLLGEVDTTTGAKPS